MYTECPRQYFTHGFCQRQGAHIFYAISGIICNSRANNAECSIDKTLYAANFGYGALTPNGTDSRNIQYHWDGNKHKFDDPGNIWHENTMNFPASGFPEEDKFLYLGYMWGETYGSRPVRCISLTLDLAGDGDYEISFKTGEFAHDKSRVFSIQLNGQYVVDEIEIRAYRPIKLALELNVNFKISQDETKIEIQGHPIRELLQQRQIKLVLCTSKCNRWAQDTHYTFNAISVVKFVKQ